MSELAQRQESIIEMAQDLMAVLRENTDVEGIHAIKEVQDTLRMQYERYQFDARDLLRKRSKELQHLQNEANEPHRAEFEAARAALEEQQLQLQDTIKELKQRISDHEASRKAAVAELHQLSKQEKDMVKDSQEKQAIATSLVELFQNITSISWDLDSNQICGTFWGVQSTLPFNIDPENGSNVCNKLWKMIDDQSGFVW